MAAGTILAVARTDAWHSLEGWKVLSQLHPGAEGRTDASSCICWKSKCFPRISLRTFAQTICTNIPELAYPSPTPGFGATVPRVRLKEHSVLLT